VIPAELRSNVFVYFDDLLILAPDFQTHFTYLGFISTEWYRRFVKNFATLAAPLSEVLKKAGNTKFSLVPSSTQEVDEMKLALTRAPVLVHADFKKHFYIQCDASYVGVSAVLFQRNQNGDEQPITFFSAKMNKHQVNYWVTEKNCLAANLAIRKFRPYVEKMPFMQY